MNRALTQFQEGWNHHGVRTEHGLTPNQLFTAGALQLQGSGLVALDFFEEVNLYYGVEEAGLPTEEVEGVEVPATHVQLTHEQFAELQQLVNPLNTCSDYGIDMYQETVEYVCRVGTLNDM